MVRNNRLRSRKLSKKRVYLPDKQTGGSPSYRFHSNAGLLSQSSLEYSPIGLTSHQQGFSDHIVATSGGGRKGRKGRKSLKKSLSSSALRVGKSVRTLRKSLMRKKSNGKRSNTNGKRSNTNAKRNIQK